MDEVCLYENIYALRRHNKLLRHASLLLICFVVRLRSNDTEKNRRIIIRAWDS